MRFLALMLTDLQVFYGAPHITCFDKGDNFALQSMMRQYWDSRSESSDGLSTHRLKARVFLIEKKDWRISI